MTVLLREARATDVDRVFKIRTSVRENHLSMDELAALGITPQSLPAMLEHPGRGWVAEVLGEVVVFAMADAEEATVFAMFVAPGHENRGLGRRLMQAAEQWLFAQGVETVWLLTDSDRAVRANGFYRHLGWVDDGVQPDGQVRFVKSRDALATAER